MAKMNESIQKNARSTIHGYLIGNYSWKQSKNIYNAEMSKCCNNLRYFTCINFHGIISLSSMLLGNLFIQIYGKKYLSQNCI